MADPQTPETKSKATRDLQAHYDVQGRIHVDTSPPGQEDERECVFDLQDDKNGTFKMSFPVPAQNGEKLPSSITGTVVDNVVHVDWTSLTIADRQGIPYDLGPPGELYKKLQDEATRAFTDGVQPKIQKGLAQTAPQQSTPAAAPQSQNPQQPGKPEGVIIGTAPDIGLGHIQYKYGGHTYDYATVNGEPLQVRQDGHYLGKATRGLIVAPDGHVIENGNASEALQAYYKQAAEAPSASQPGAQPPLPAAPSGRRNLNQALHVDQPAADAASTPAIGKGPFNAAGFATIPSINKNGFAGTAVITKTDCRTPAIDDSINSVVIDERNASTGVSRSISAEMGKDGKMHPTFIADSGVELHLATDAKGQTQIIGIGRGTYNSQTHEMTWPPVSAADRQKYAPMVAAASDEANTTLVAFKNNPNAAAPQSQYPRASMHAPVAYIPPPVAPGKPDIDPKTGKGTINFGRADGGQSTYTFGGYDQSGALRFTEHSTHGNGVIVTNTGTINNGDIAITSMDIERNGVITKLNSPNEISNATAKDPRISSAYQDAAGNVPFVAVTASQTHSQVAPAAQQPKRMSAPIAP